MVDLCSTGPSDRPACGMESALGRHVPWNSGAVSIARRRPNWWPFVVSSPSSCPGAVLIPPGASILIRWGAEYAVSDPGDWLLCTDRRGGLFRLWRGGFPVRGRMGSAFEPLRSE